MTHQSAAEILALADYRRQVAELYASVRTEHASAQAGWLEWVRGRNRLFQVHSQSPLDAAQKASFSRLRYFPFQADLKVLADLQPLADESILETNLAGDGVFRIKRAGRLSFLLRGQSLNLVVYWILGYGGGLFLPFRDLTNGDTTYGGGRYLLDTIKGADLGTQAGRLVLDFNYAYNPSCAYHPRWECPLAQPENWLPVEIPAGEMDFSGAQ